MKKSIKILLVFAAILFLGTACSSDDENPMDQSIYYFRFKVDGNQVDYQYQPQTQINLTGGKYYDDVNQLHIIQLSGAENIFQPLQNQVIFRLDHTEDLITGVNYSNVPISDGTILHTLLFSYMDENGTAYLATNNLLGLALWDEVRIRFDQIDSNGLKGVFSGTGKVYDSSGGTNTLIGQVTITEGEFFVPRNNE
jgi:hypothetical protein